MPLKTFYKSTRADAADLARDAQPGDLLYAIGGSEFVVTNETSALNGAHMVRPAEATTGPGVITLSQLLSRCSVIFTQPPTQN
ncbi:hypothetical protein ACFVZH_20845 [Streptomyces sp. NPDC059534]|uniref:hypothetical protein n=1 Tax=Streptomyces sp. NPDC059534 TaxID=3346859 RepID=UPI00369F49CF